MIALSTDFVDALNPVLVAVLLVAALASKLLSVMLGARLAGLRADRYTWAIAWGLNARGPRGSSSPAPVVPPE